MEWSNDDILEFLDYYEDEPLIWNATNPQHKNRNDVYEAWKRIEIRLGHKYTVTELKKKKESLMASFRACYNKVMQSIKNSSGMDDIYRPNWFAYEKMVGFLKDKDKIRETIKSEESISHEKTIETFKIEVEYNDVISDENDGREIDEDINNEEMASPMNSKSTFKAPTRKRNRRSEDEDLKSQLNDAYSVLKSSVEKSQKEKDVCDIYGELVGAKLRRMDDRNREIAMNRIDNFLFEMNMNRKFYLK